MAYQVCISCGRKGVHREETSEGYAKVCKYCGYTRQFFKRQKMPKGSGMRFFRGK